MNRPGALLAGIVADLLGLRWAIGAVGALTLVSGVLVVVVMTETLPASRVGVAAATQPMPESG